MKSKHPCFRELLASEPISEGNSNEDAQALKEYRARLEPFRLDGVSDAFTCERIGCLAIFGNHREFSRIELAGNTCAEQEKKAVQYKQEQTAYDEFVLGDNVHNDLRVMFSDICRDSEADRQALEARQKKQNA